MYDRFTFFLPVEGHHARNRCPGAEMVYPRHYRILSSIKPCKSVDNVLLVSFILYACGQWH